MACSAFRISERLHSATLHKHDYISAYVGDLGNVVDMESIRSAGVQVGIDPLGGAAVHYWPAVIEKYGIKATVVSDVVDPTFRFMTADWDGKIRMDCSSPYAMVRLLAMRDRFDVAFANDTDADRHGIVTRSSGLMNPNHYLAVAISYLFRNRPRWRKDAAVGKTVVSSSMIDRVAANLERKLIETPVGFKWFVDGLIDGSVGFCGEESAGASFLRTDGTVWTTDKDGLILGLLAAEITARAGRDPGALYDDLTREFGTPAYERIDAPATLAQKEILKKLTPEQLDAHELAGEKILKTMTVAPGNGAAIGGIKVIAESGWFAARPSGTEEVYKIYAESFRGVDHLHQIQAEAQELIARVLQAGRNWQGLRNQLASSPHILCINVGSSSCKFALYSVAGGAESVIAEGAADRIGSSGGKIRIRDANGRSIAESDRDARTSASCRRRTVRRVRAPEAAAPRRGRPSNRARRRAACRPGARHARAARGFERADPIRTATHAGRHRRNRGGCGAASEASAGRMLRHRISSRNARARRALSHCRANCGTPEYAATAFTASLTSTSCRL